MNVKATRSFALIALCLAAFVGQGCAEERDPINRVQPDALAKSFFIGEDIANPADNPSFYANGTLLDIGYGAAQFGLFSAFYSNDLSIIRWEVTEDYLIGRLAFERIEDTDGKGAGQETNDGQMTYVFKIKKHFDVRRAYNQSTGEEYNVVEENASDRPWYEREYMRIDWSQNLNSDGYDFDTMAVYGLLFGIEFEPMAYYVNDPDHPNAPRFEVEDGYFDVTTKAYAKPGMVDLSHLGWGYDKLPSCWLSAEVGGGTAPSANCNPHEITIRNSFWKVQDTDYQPDDWDGFRFQAFGAFTKKRTGFARNYGMSDLKRRRFISRYNIWERSHHYSNPSAMTGAVECFTPQTTMPKGADPNRDFDINGTADECEAVGNGSQCDIFKQKCTLPFMQRKVRPIVWYYTDSSTPRFYQSTAEARIEWDAAMRNAVLAAKNAECNRLYGKTENNCDWDFPSVHGQMTMMRDAVEILAEVETCRRPGGGWTAKGCEQIIHDEILARGYPQESQDYLALTTLATMGDTVVLCHSPVEAGDHPLCAEGKPRLPASVTAAQCYESTADGGDPSVRAACKAAYRVRIGDVRHHLINVIQSPETPSPWGFGPTYANPLTGEGISASINVWSAPTDMIAQSTVDISRFIAGELKAEQITDGEYVEQWVKAATFAAEGGALPRMTRAQREQRIDSVMRAASRDLQTGVTPEVLEAPARGLAKDVPLSPEVQKHLAEFEKLRHTRFSAHESSTMLPTYMARMKAGRNSETEAALMTKPIQQLAGDIELAGEALTELTSPIRALTNPSIQRRLRYVRENALAERGACMLHADHAAPSPTSMMGLSKKLQEKFGAFNADDPADVQYERAKRMKEYMAHKMHFAVIIHEMGHTFGYRHNFVSSSSALNYRPQYWQLRTKNGTVTEECTDLANTEAEAAACVGPRYFDPVTTEEQENLIWTWSHSSVMDYAGDYTQDLIGLGGYDFAAAKMFYGGTASVFADNDLSAESPLSSALVGTVMDNFGGILGYKYESAPGTNIHYSQLQKHYKLINDCEAIDPETFRPTGWDTAKMGEWNPTLDGLLVQVDGQYSRCKQRRVDHVQWDQLSMPTGDLANYRGGPAISPNFKTRVPYAFATDGWADIGNLSVYRHDNGADPYEIFNFFITEQELRHIFDNYRRDRHGFSVRKASSRILSRYNEKMRDGAKGMSLIHNNILNRGPQVGLEPESWFRYLVGAWGAEDNMLAASYAFDHFARQLQRPQAGPHALPQGVASGTKTAVYQFDDFGTPQVIVPDGPQGFYQTVGIGGKLVNNTLADEYDEYDREYTMNAGSYYDKIYTPMLFAESEDNFISSSLGDFVDPRYRAVSLADLFPDGYRRWLSNNLTGDTWIKSPRLAVDQFGLPATDQAGYPATPIGWTSWWPDTPEICFPNAGTSICSSYETSSTPFEAINIASTRAVDGQVGWEQQKWLVSFTLIYLPANQKRTWLDMMDIWSLGDDSQPGLGIDNRIELHVPGGDTYVAQTFGREQICFEECKTVERGISARVLQYANELLAKAYVTAPVTTAGGTEWHVPLYQNGKPIVRYDESLQSISPGGQGAPPPPGCSPDPTPNDTDYSTFVDCECANNGSCKALKDYVSMPDFIRLAMRDFIGWDPSKKKGIY
jgi:hypothetical protein